MLVFFYMGKDRNSVFIFYSAAEKTLVFEIYIIFYIFEMNKTQICSSYNMNDLRHIPVTHDQTIVKADFRFDALFCLFAVMQIVCVVKEWILSLAKTKKPLDYSTDVQVFDCQVVTGVKT